MTTKDTYLSIDLDYWNYSRLYTAERFFRKMLDRGLRVRVVESHELLLPDIKAVPKQVRTLVNIDFHDDFSTPTEVDDDYSVVGCECNEAEWVRQVPWRRDGTYIWRYPSHTLCVKHTRGICASMQCHKISSTVSGWDTVKVKQGANVDFSRVERVGISVSPEYLNHGSLDNVPQMILDYPKARIRRAAKKCLRMMTRNEEVGLLQLFEYGEHVS